MQIYLPLFLSLPLRFLGLSALHEIPLRACLFAF